MAATLALKIGCGLVWLAVTATAYLVAGIFAFGLGERAAKHRGTLGRY